MKINEYQWEVNKKKVYGVTWEPKTQPKAVIVFIHGIGEHTRRYDKWFNRFCDLDLAIISADHHGHGHSEGKRGHFKNYNEPMNFTTMLFKKADTLFPLLPKIIYGHSMGAHISLNYLLRKHPKVKGAMVSAPWIKLYNPPSKLLLWSSWVLKLFYPSYSLHTGIKREQLTQNQAEIETSEKDRLLHGRISVNSYLAFNKAAKYVIKNIKNLHVPVLLMHGEADPIVNPEGSKILNQRCPQYIEIKIFDGFLHEIHKEKKRDIAFAEMQQFLEKVL